MIVVFVQPAGAQFFSRPKVIVHACETRCRSKSTTTRCRDVILSGVLKKVPPSLIARLEARDREVRKGALKKGHTHVRVPQPAKRVSSAGANRAAVMAGTTLPPVCTGKKRKLMPDTIPNTRLEDSKYLLPFVPRKRVSQKSSTLSLQHVAPKRLKVKACEAHLYRRV